jgi:hypothetical protein
LPVRLYFDHNVSRAIVESLRLREVDVLTAFEDKAHELSDSKLLERATASSRVLCSSDTDMVVEARTRQRDGRAFPGVIFVPQEVPIGRCIEDLELIAKAGTLDELADSLLFLPLR